MECAGGVGFLSIKIGEVAGWDGAEGIYDQKVNLDASKMTRRDSEFVKVETLGRGGVGYLGPKEVGCWKELRGLAFEEGFVVVGFVKTGVGLNWTSAFAGH